MVKRKGMPDLTKFWGRVKSVDGCWEYMGSRSTGGYGTVRVQGGYALAHRVSYELTNGPIPEGLDLDHLCRNRACVNPSHLEAVSRAENARRGARSLDFDGRCMSGMHEIKSAADVIQKNHGRTCRRCIEERRAERDAAVREAAMALGISAAAFIREYGRSKKKAKEVLNGGHS